MDQQMKVFLENFQSIQWWISVVLVGIVINLAAAYLKPGLDVLIGRISVRWVARTEKLASARRLRIQKLKNDINEQQFAATEAVYLSVRALIYYVASVIILGMSFWGKAKGMKFESGVILLFFIYVFMVGFRYNRMGLSKRRELFEARDSVDSVIG
jgi:hypothetical protein